MTKSEKVDILRTYKDIDRRIKMLLDEKERWMERATSITPVYKQAPVSGGDGSGKIQSAIEKIDEIERELVDEIGRLADLRQIIVKGIAGIRSCKLRNLMTYRYIQGMTLERTAYEMGMDERWVRRLQSRAINQLTLESPP